MIIPSLGNYGWLQRALDGYSRQTVPTGTFQVIVVTDALDPDPEAVKRAIGTRSYPVRNIVGPTPGASANRNAGIRLTETPLVLFTDNDTVPTPELVSGHLRWHQQYPADNTGVLGRVRWSRDQKMTPLMRWLDSGMQFDFARIKGTEAGWGRFVTANCSLKRSFLEAVGNFDQDNLPYLYEDTDWAYRASKRGFRLLYNSQAVVDHLSRMTIDSSRVRFERVAAAEFTFSRLHPELPPWFYNLFSAAAASPPCRGRAAQWARFVPPWVPWIGPQIWRRVDLSFKQRFAPYFLAAWEDAKERRSTESDNSTSASALDAQPPANRHH